MPTLLRRPNLIAGVAAAVFLFYALNYLYFFVDDEAISLVYARNLIRGHGLVYSALEGPVEGYSNFLYVWLEAAALAVLKLPGVGPLGVFVFGKMLSLACGMAVVYLTLLTAFDLPEAHPAGPLAAAAMIALSGPLALWSCSTMETAIFALAVAGLARSLVRAGVREDWSPRSALAWALLVSLLRIDGPLYAAALLGAFAITAVTARRRILNGVVLPLVVVMAIYEAWRIWYFGDLLPTPVYAKVLYKVTPWKHVVAKAARESYVLGFLRDGGGAMLLVLVAGGLLLRPNRTTAALGLAAAAMAAYAAFVGDWMFGDRFFVALIPLFGLLASATIARLARWRQVAAWAVAVAVVVWFGQVARAFELRYFSVEKRESWLTHPTLDPARFFAPYWALYEQVRPYVRAHDVIAYDQAGFVPYMLDVDNVDYLGICSRFVAKLPTTDVFFTEVGRYTPLTNVTAYTAGQAYLLARSPRLVLAGTGLLRKANGNAIPNEILGGHYRLRLVASDESQAAYARTNLSTDAFRHEPRRYLENIAHPSRLAHAAVDGAVVEPSGYTQAFPYLYEAMKILTFTGSYAVDLKLTCDPAPIYEVHVNHIEADRPARFEISLWTADGRATYTRTLDVQPRRAVSLHDELPEPIAASRVALRVSAPQHDPVLLWIIDLRIQGQPPALAAYVKGFLSDPAALRPSR